MKAYFQGEVDFFCSIYAIINACRIAAQGYHKFSFRQGCEFYQHMIQYLYDSDKFLDVLYHGADYDLMDALIAKADEYLQSKYNLRIISARPFRGRDASLTRIYRLVRKYLQGAEKSCIIRLNNSTVLDHWSVIEKTDNNFFGLFDSYMYGGMSFGRSVLDDGNIPEDKSATRINKDGIILIKIVRCRTCQSD